MAFIRRTPRRRSSSAAVNTPGPPGPAGPAPDVIALTRRAPRRGFSPSFVRSIRSHRSLDAAPAPAAQHRETPRTTLREPG
ncbi:hypothetical protein SCA03_38930 [Streptomyces cacaoi]|uniref:Uncharacterized protein n=1 Tax=Streptomyces cacaoi TaxID=1898 RepID=A0A4Y3R1E0_STRCI|nr:hypothetical protein SCA03_38930 [Streptomyces cacaoi]